MKNRRKAVQPFEIKKRKIDIFRNYEANGFEKNQRKFENFSTLISKKSTDTVDVIDLIEEDQPQETTLRINANGMTFEFRTLNPEDSVVGILRKMSGAA